MKKTPMKTMVAAAAIMLSSCTANYDAYYNSEGLDRNEYIAIPKRERPVVTEALDLPAALKARTDAGYLVIGSMQIEGRHATLSEITKYAAEKGASLVLYSSTKTGTIRQNYVLPIPSSSTTHHSGTITGTGFASPSYSYSGTSTTTSVQYLNRSYEIDSCLQNFIFLAKKR